MELQAHFSHITHLIAEAKQRAYQAVNHELVTLYWNIGEYLHQQVSTKAWGKAVVQELATFIAHTEPNVKGFSAQNLWRMKQFYETYKDEPKLSTLLREIGWSHNSLIFSSCKTTQEREFYLHLTRKERLSFRELERQINASYYERVMMGNAKLGTLQQTLPQDIPMSSKIIRTGAIAATRYPPRKRSTKSHCPKHHQISAGIWPRLCLYGRRVSAASGRPGFRHRFGVLPSEIALFGGHRTEN